MSTNRNDRKDIRRKEAEERNAAWASLTPEQQIAELDNRFGAGLGAKKQRARIMKKIEAGK